MSLDVLKLEVVRSLNERGEVTGVGTHCESGSSKFLECNNAVQVRNESLCNMRIIISGLFNT